MANFPDGSTISNVWGSFKTQLVAVLSNIDNTITQNSNNIAQNSNNIAQNTHALKASYDGEIYRDCFIENPCDGGFVFDGFLGIEDNKIYYIGTNNYAHKIYIADILTKEVRVFCDVPNEIPIYSYYLHEGAIYLYTFSDTSRSPLSVFIYKCTNDNGIVSMDTIEIPKADSAHFNKMDIFIKGNSIFIWVHSDGTNGYYTSFLYKGSIVNNTISDIRQVYSEYQDTPSDNYSWRWSYVSNEVNPDRIIFGTTAWDNEDFQNPISLGKYPVRCTRDGMYIYEQREPTGVLYTRLLWARDKDLSSRWYIKKFESSEPTCNFVDRYYDGYEYCYAMGSIWRTKLSL